MKIGYVSDFHLEILQRYCDTPEQMWKRAMNVMPPEESFDVLMACGDMGHSKWVIEAMAILSTLIKTPILYTPGNHEFYDCNRGRTLQGALECMERETVGTGVTLLHNDYRDFPEHGVSIWMSPWYTDFSVMPEAIELGVGVNDYHLTFTRGRPTERKITTMDHVRMNHVAQSSLQAWLTGCLERGLKPVVGTHWGPSRRSAHADFPQDEPIAAYFYTDYLDRNHSLFPPGTVWVHGHTHYNVDYQLGNVRVCSNQLGYTLLNGGSSSEKNCREMYSPLKYVEV